MRFAPARHFAPSRQCVACLRTFSTVMLVQAHLRRTPKCLRRATWLIDPLDFEEIKEAESIDTAEGRAGRLAATACDCQSLSRGGSLKHHRRRCRAVSGELLDRCSGSALSAQRRCCYVDRAISFWLDTCRAKTTSY